MKYRVSENEKESNTRNSVCTDGRLTKRPILETPVPDKFFHNKKNNNDMNNLDKLAGALVTLSQQIVTPPAVQTSQYQKEGATNFDSEVEAFLQIIKASLYRTNIQQRVPCLIQLLNILHDFEKKD